MQLCLLAALLVVESRRRISYCRSKNQLKDLIDKHFSGTQPALGRTDKVFHTIDTGDAPAVKQRYYPMSPARQRMVCEELDKMLQLGVVEPSKSDWSSPILLVDKPDGSKRVCVNFKKLNSVSKKDAYPLPQVTTILDRLRDACYMSSLDIKSAFWQIPLDPSSREKTAFTVPGRGLFHLLPCQWVSVMPLLLGKDSWIMSWEQTWNRIVSSTSMIL